MKAAIFDLDGTLLDSMWIWEKLVDNYLESIGVEPPTNLRDTLKKLSLLEGCYYIQEKCKINKSPEEINEEIENILAGYYAEKFLLKPYAIEILEELRNRSIRICLATATADHLVALAFKRLGIAEYFEFIQTSNNVGVGKKEPKFFEIAIERLNIDPKDIWVFEDALHCIISAKKCNLNVVALPDDSAKEDLDEIKKIADIYIDDLSQLNINSI